MGKGQGFGTVQRPVKQQRYVIESERTEDFLVSMVLPNGQALCQWTKDPGKAKVYKRFEDASEIAKQLVREKLARFWVCSIKDKGNQWQVLRETVFASSPNGQDVDWDVAP